MSPCASSVLPLRWETTEQHGPAAVRRSAGKASGALDGPASATQECSHGQPGCCPNCGSLRGTVLTDDPEEGRNQVGLSVTLRGTVTGHPLCPALQLGEQVTPTLTDL